MKTRRPLLCFGVDLSTDLPVVEGGLGGRLVAVNRDFKLSVILALDTEIVVHPVH